VSFFIGWTIPLMSFLHMTTPCERKKPCLKIDLTGLRSHVQVSGTPWPKTWNWPVRTPWPGTDLFWTPWPETVPDRGSSYTPVPAGQVQVSGVGLGWGPLWNRH
jgi:hypothetical protein